tara:strand:+ start:1136 stop:1426 length:291 start_codon:yes stop_codon:yes gene_type:complete
MGLAEWQVVCAGHGKVRAVPGAPGIQGDQLWHLFATASQLRLRFLLRPGQGGDVLAQPVLSQRRAGHDADDPAAEATEEKETHVRATGAHLFRAVT